MANFEHSDQLVVYINRCHTYPSTGSRGLAMWIADNYYPGSDGVVLTYPAAQEIFSASRATVGRWFKELRSTEMWDSERVGRSGATRYFLAPDEMKRFEFWISRKAVTGRKLGTGTVVVSNDPEDYIKGD